MKKRFLFIVALLSVLTMTGCKDKDDTARLALSAPQEITVQSNGEKSLIIFDEVKNAEYYDIYINDVCVTVKSNGTGTIQFDASKIITLPQKYTIKVKAGGNNYFDSEFTEVYEYNHTTMLEAPVISIDGTTLNWNKIPNAEFYDVVVTSFNPTVQTTHRFATNRFNFANILANKGEYVFKVQAVSESGEYTSSLYSNQVKYVHKLTLTTPYNLKVAYSQEVGEYLLSFVSSENVDGFTINIDGTNYALTQSEMKTFLYNPNDLKNVYVVKLTTFAKSKGFQLDSSTLMNISVKANTSNNYLQSSEFSNSITCQFTSVLVAPRINITKTDTTCTIDIISNNDGSKYLSGFAIYLNDEKYKTISSDITQIELPLTDKIRNSTIRVQAISNNSNCYSSNLSDGKQIGTMTPLNIGNVVYNDGVITWENVAEATSYYVEIINSSFRYAQFTTETSLDISTSCPSNGYWVKVTAMAYGHAQAEGLTNINHMTQLATPTNINVVSDTNGTYLYFDEVEGAYGYVLYLNNNDEEVKYLFASSPINLTPYISVGNGYTVQIQAVEMINSAIQSSEVSDKQLVQSTKTLTTPSLTIANDGDKYYLNIFVNESEAEITDGYEVWVNYQSIGIFKSSKIDITSYFGNAGQYNFMAKAKAIDSPYIKDSNMASLTYNCIKQLDTVTDIKVTKIEDESKYILTFKEQTLAAKYLVTIVKGDDEDYNVEFELNHCVADISSYLVENGVYRIYVQALATKDSFYTDSATSGNPYRLTKGETLALPQNINVVKNEDNNSIINLSWNSVENCSGYQVYVYYNGLNENILKKSIFVSQSLTPSIDIGSGEYLCLDKEGRYTIQIKALGDNKLYENSQTATYSYTYTMERISDFIRNSIFIGGNTYNYNVSNAEQLKNLLWYHYLYNQDVWQYNTLEYNLKVNMSANLDDIANEISESIATQVEYASTDVEKMNIISKALLAQYPEILNYREGSEIQSFCLNPETNIYIFRYQDKLDDVKTSTITTTNQVYKEKLDIVDAFDQRNSTYVFAIDNQQSVDVTTTEQLFMALQYNEKPNFIGDCGVAKAVYENARFILRQICSDDMSEYDKTLQIYDFLTKQITWNNVTTGSFDDEVTASDLSSTLRGNLKDLYLEGILYNFESENGLYTSLDQIVGNTADSEGLSKAFVVLCAIEGIDAIKVNGQKTVDVDGTSTNVDYSWNKVYIDIEEDGIEGKRWYVVDVTGAIQNNISITKSGVTNTYQIALHKYFLITDADFKIQATSWHKRLGEKDSENNEISYVANTSFDYYSSQKYSCVYRKNTIVDNATFTATNDNDIINAMIYASLKANKKHRVIVDIYASAYIGGSSVDSIKSKINALYATACDKLGNEYNCNIAVTIVENKYIVMAFQSENYAQ